MDAHKHEELNDGLLAREIEAALDIDPSPEFLARVRTRVARERDNRDWAWLGVWRWASAVTVVTAVAVMAFWSLRAPVTAPREVRISTPTVEPSRTAPSVLSLPNEPLSTPVASTDSPAPQRRPVARTVRPATRRAGVMQGEVVISPDEGLALRHLVVAIVARQVEAADIPELGGQSAPLPAIEEIVLEPITLSPMDGVLE